MSFARPSDPTSFRYDSRKDNASFLGAVGLLIATAGDKGLDEICYDIFNGEPRQASLKDEEEIVPKMYSWDCLAGKDSVRTCLSKATFAGSSSQRLTDLLLTKLPPVLSRTPLERCRRFVHRVVHIAAIGFASSETRRSRDTRNLGRPRLSWVHRHSLSDRLDGSHLR